MDSITQAHPFRFCDICIAGCLPELHKIDLDIDVRLRQAGVLQVGLYVVPQLCLRRFFLKLRCTVQHGYLLKRTVMLNRDHLFRQFKERAVFRMFPVRMHSCDHIFNGPLHLEIDQVLAVDDLYAVVSAPVSVEHGRVHIPLVLPAVGIQHGAVHTAETSSHRCRACDREGRRAVNVRPEGKGTVRSRMAFQCRHCCLRTNRRKGGNRDEVLLILDVPGSDLQHAGQRGRDLIDSKRLIGRPLGRLCQNDVPLHQVFRMKPGCGIFHLQLIAAVPLFCHIAGGGIAELPDAISGESGLCFRIEARDHLRHLPSQRPPPRCDLHMVYRSAPCDMVLAGFQIREVVALHISVTEAGSIIGVVGLTVQINITVVSQDAD